MGEWRDVLGELPKRIHEWMPRLASEGVVGADAIFACLGPALEIFSRYSRVEKANGDTATLREYLEHVWAAELPIEDRRQLLLEYWDSRVDSPEGDLARMAVEAFMRGVVMQSDTPFTDAEIAAMNARRTCQRMLVLTGPVPQ